MAYVTPTSKTTGDLIAATDWNQNTVDNPIAIRTGGIAIASQAAGDIITASSSTQLGRSAITGFALHTVCNGRLTLTTGTPVTTSDVTAATTLYFAPYEGRQIGLYDGSSAWTVVSFNELSIAVPATTSTMYDVYVYNNSGTATLELTAWTNDTTRATALTTQDGIYVKTGATTRRYIGSFRTTGVSGQTEDSAAKRYVFNYYNRVTRQLSVTASGTAYWTYTTATWRQAAGNTAFQLDVVVGVAEEAVQAVVSAAASNSSGNIDYYAGIGYDSTTAPMVKNIGQMPANLNHVITVSLSHTPAVGRHYYTWCEYSYNVGTTTWSGASGQILSGIWGTYRM